ADAQPPVTAEPQKAPAPVAATVPQSDAANAARIAHIEAAAARLAAAGSNAPAQPATPARPKHRIPAAAHAQIARSEPESTDR
ncbi:secretin, partial [Burkholderia aenigmatica]|nr:secretin [Burkholderia aenigmatica]